MKPGPGWKHVGGAVFDYCDGTRVHVGGYCRLPNGEFISGNTIDQMGALNRFIRINGGNRKRGVMAWAKQVAPPPT
jgi:hypothetical protein